MFNKDISFGYSLKENSMVYKLLNNISDDKKGVYSKEEVQGILEELSIYQTELEAQNAELIEKDKKLLNITNEFKLLFNDAPIPFILLDKDLEIKKYNFEADRYFDFSSLMLPIRSIFTILKTTNIEQFIRWINNRDFVHKAIEVDMLCVGNKANRFKISAKPYTLKDDWLIISLVDIQKEYEIHENLENLVEEKTQESIKQYQVIEKQSKIASMGEMIDAIAHQWITPLTIMKFFAQEIQIESTNKRINKKRVHEKSKGVLTQISHLLDTLSEFRTFFRPNKKLEYLSIDLLLSSIKVLIKDELMNHKIQLSIKGDLEQRVKVIPNEFKHVLLNLFTNTRDAFNSKGIKNREVLIDVKSDENRVILLFKDNAGGIPEHIIGRIFEPDFTTKEEGIGTGIGLYLCKQILDKIGATIEVENLGEGVCFKVSFDS